MSRKDYCNLTFEEVATWICNDDLHVIAGEGVYYLMTFISLGALAVEFNENIDFIKIELSYIFENKLLEKMKVRINCESYIDMQQDSEKIKQHFASCEPQRANSISIDAPKGT